MSSVVDPDRFIPDGRPIEEYPNRIAEMFVDKTIFITGGTGFMGKVLVEKLLRCNPGIKKMYLLIRTKKGKEAKERLREIFNGPLFDLLKKTCGEKPLEKVVALSGDCSLLDLGLSPEDRKIIQDEVQIVYHCAATVRFDEPLKRAVLLNTRGTKLMLELAHEIKNLLLFVHVSTSYCHLHERVLYEKPYDPPASPEHVIKTVEWMDDEIVDAITHKILGNIPNTYAFTKALSEGLVNKELDKLPIILLRPSVVIPIWKEPLPGWTDNINGPTGLLIGAGKGVIRTMYCNGTGYADYLPVDIAVNALICATLNYFLDSKHQIYNLTSSAEYKITWEEIIELGREVIEKRVPLNGILWYPGGSMKKNRYVHYLAVLFFHLIPAFFIDCLLFVLGYKPILIKIHKRILKGFDVFEYYANNQWDFNNEYGLRARHRLNAKEAQIYCLTGDGINYHDYFTDCVLAARRYILKETDDTIPAAKRQMKIKYYLDKFCKTVIICGFLYFLYCKVIAPFLQ